MLAAKKIDELLHLHELLRLPFQSLGLGSISHVPYSNQDSGVHKYGFKQEYFVNSIMFTNVDVQLSDEHYRPFPRAKINCS
jgi:hypothetical protein